VKFGAGARFVVGRADSSARYAEIDQALYLSASSAD